MALFLLLARSFQCLGHLSCAECMGDVQSWRCEAHKSQRSTQELWATSGKCRTGIFGSCNRLGRPHHPGLITYSSIFEANAWGDQRKRLRKLGPQCRGLQG